MFFRTFLIIRFYSVNVKGEAGYLDHFIVLPMTFSLSKEQVLAKMQEFDASLQAVIAATQVAVGLRTELWSMLANLPDDKHLVEISIPLTFYENGHVIAWGNDSEHFSPSTFRLVQQLWHAADHFISKEDVREAVQEDEESSPGSIRTCLSRAREELGNVDFPYKIETVHSKGYRLTAM
jgi:DNA-binding response OmpR family regulator